MLVFHNPGPGLAYDKNRIMEAIHGLMSTVEVKQAPHIEVIGEAGLNYECVRGGRRAPSVYSCSLRALVLLTCPFPPIHSSPPMAR
jgi:hypothetical protein